VLAPQQGITHDPKGNASALVVNSAGKVEPRVIRASRTIGNQWLIDDGLAAGDRLIVEGVQKVQPGMDVKAVEASGASNPADSAAASASPAAEASVADAPGSGK